MPTGYPRKARAFAKANIAFIKYWGDRDERLRLPSNGSISMNLAGLETYTTVAFDESLDQDRLKINGRVVEGIALDRVALFLDHVRYRAGIHHFAEVDSENNFPSSAGIASSASAFAALALASARAAGLDLDEAGISRLARLGSGSACRSVPEGFVEWRMGTSDQDSYAVSIAPPGHWDLVDCIAIVNSGPKDISSTEGHALANSSPFQAVRVADAPRRLEICRSAILHRDFGALADIVELDSHMMHAVMMTSTPPLMYWQEATLTVLRAVREHRSQGLPACATIDAGANVHVICESGQKGKVGRMLRSLPGVRRVLVAGPGGAARLAE